MSNHDFNEKRNGKKSEREYALIDIVCLLDSDDDFSSVKQFSDCVTAVFTDKPSGREHHVRMECVNPDPYSKMFRAQIDFRCPQIKPEAKANVGEYVMLTNDLANELYDQSCLTTADNGSIVIAQMNCSDHEELPQIVSTMATIIEAVKDDIICLAGGRLPAGLLDGRVMERFGEVVQNELGQLLVAEELAAEELAKSNRSHDDPDNEASSDDDLPLDADVTGETESCTDDLLDTLKACLDEYFANNENTDTDDKVFEPIDIIKVFDDADAEEEINIEWDESPDTPDQTIDEVRDEDDDTGEWQ